MTRGTDYQAVDPYGVPNPQCTSFSDDDDLDFAAEVFLPDIVNGDVDKAGDLKTGLNYRTFIRNFCMP